MCESVKILAHQKNENLWFSHTFDPVKKILILDKKKKITKGTILNFCTL